MRVSLVSFFASLLVPISFFLAGKAAFVDFSWGF
jgi:hypothetical protein